MDRLLIEDLKIWKDKSDRKPLILRGARQVGKTWITKEFGKSEYKDLLYVNKDLKKTVEKGEYLIKIGPSLHNLNEFKITYK